MEGNDYRELEQSWKTPDELGVSKSMECDIFLQCFDTVGQQEGIRPVKKLDVGLLVLMI